MSKVCFLLTLILSPSAFSQTLWPAAHTDRFTGAFHGGVFKPNGPWIVVTEDGIYTANKDKPTVWKCTSAFDSPDYCQVVGGSPDLLYIVVNVADINAKERLLERLVPDGQPQLIRKIASNICGFENSMIGCFADHGSLVFTHDGGKTWNDPLLLWRDENICRVQWLNATTVVAFGERGTIAYCEDDNKAVTKVIWKVATPQLQPVSFVAKDPGTVLGLCGFNVFEFDARNGASKKLFNSELAGGEEDLWLFGEKAWVVGSTAISVHDLNNGKLLRKLEAVWPYALIPQDSNVLLMSIEGKLFTLQSDAKKVEPLQLTIDNTLLSAKQEAKWKAHPSATQPSRYEMYEMGVLSMQAGRQITDQVMVEAYAKKELSPRERTLWITEQLKLRTPATQPEK